MDASGVSGLLDDFSVTAIVPFTLPFCPSQPTVTLYVPGTSEERTRDPPTSAPPCPSPASSTSATNASDFAVPVLPVQPRTTSRTSLPGAGDAGLP